MRYHPNKSPFKWFATNVRLDLCPTLNITKKERALEFIKGDVSKHTCSKWDHHHHHHNNNSKPFISNKKALLQSTVSHGHRAAKGHDGFTKLLLCLTAGLSRWLSRAKLPVTQNRSCRATNAATKHRIIKILGKLESCTGFCRFLMLMLKACHCETFLAAQACVKCSTLKKHPQFWCLLELWCLPKRNWCL